MDREWQINIFVSQSKHIHVILREYGVSKAKNAIAVMLQYWYEDC